MERSMFKLFSLGPAGAPSCSILRVSNWLAVSLVAAGTLLGAGPALAHEFKTGSIVIEQPWSRATPGGAQVAAGYLTIRNDGTAPDRLAAATADIAGLTEIHLMSMVDGVMQMRQVTEGLPVPAGGAVALAPGAYHLMFMDLKRQLKAGEQFSGTQTYEKAGTLEVTFEVEAAGAAAPRPAE
jgi:copper(I)-binding protein